MYRKRKTIAPDFRIPVPYNPIQGSDNPLYGPWKPYARFVLAENLTTADESATANITTTHQWGPGLYHSPDIIIHVHNLLTDTDDVYFHSGSAGDIGFALWDHDNHWRIIGIQSAFIMPECCLAENHPGRNTVFEVYLGVWDPDSDIWTYPDTTTTYKAIDRRYGVPYPNAGAKGLFTPRSSTTYGTIYECVSLDCASPGTCDD